MYTSEVYESCYWSHRGRDSYIPAVESFACYCMLCRF